MLAEQRPHSEPIYLINALESAWNGHDAKALADLFDESAVLVMEPDLEQPAGEGRYEGRAAILELLSHQMPGGAIVARDLVAEGDTATWEFEQTSDALRGLGLSGAAGHARAVVRDGEIQEIWLTFSAETIGQIRSARE